jgi:enoyl-CoA hydratase/carnithine racemase
MTGLRIETLGRTTVVTIDNPAKANAFTAAMTAELLGALEAAERDPGVRCVIVTGAGTTAFSSGHDLADMAGEPILTVDGPSEAAFRYPRAMSTPVIAAVNGAAYAAGLMLVLSSPIRIASENASFCASGARLGLPPVGGQMSDLPRIVAPAVAAEMLLTARPLGATRAHALGMVSQIVPSAREVLGAALDMATSIEDNSPAVLATVLAGLRIQREIGSVAAEAFETSAVEAFAVHPDAREGIDAFLNGRTPVFGDRAPEPENAR